MKPIVEAFRAIGRDVNKRQDSVYYGLMVIGAGALVSYGQNDKLQVLLWFVVGKEITRALFWKNLPKRRLAGDKFTPIDPKKNSAAAALAFSSAGGITCIVNSFSPDLWVYTASLVAITVFGDSFIRGYQQLSSRGASLLELPKIYIDMWDYDGEDGPTRYERLKGALTKTMREMSAGFARPVPIRVRSNNAALLLPKAP